ncbi:MAG: trypsin-like serine protease [Bdellovibrionota bacterium]|nr:MAG: trypsin-like serine protease [Bdellovibrionota bacterium]
MKLHRVTIFAVLSLLLLGALSGCDKAKVKASANGTGADATTVTYEKILNGDPVDEASAPQLVEIALLYGDGSAGICSGVVIGPQEILSATHCFLDNPEDVQVLHNGIPLEVFEVVAAPGFRSEQAVSAFFNDVAIIKTAPHGLPAFPVLQSTPVTPGEEVIILGYGLDEEGNFGTLKSGVARIEIVTPNHLFTAPYYGKDGSNPCFGDSGGPALVERKGTAGESIFALAGVVSSGTTDNCLDGDVTLFTSLQDPAVVDFLSRYASGISFL